MLLAFQIFPYSRSSMFPVFHRMHSNLVGNYRNCSKANWNHILFSEHGAQSRASRLGVPAQLVVFSSSADVFLLASDLLPRHCRVLQRLLNTNAVLKGIRPAPGVTSVRVRVRSLCSDMQKKSIFLHECCG